MIASLGLLFLMGTTASFGQFMPRPNQLPYEIAIIPRTQWNGCPTGPELAPLICKFMQQNVDLQYKPQLIAPTTYIPPLVVEKCDSPKLEMEIDLPIPIDEKKEVVIPSPPELPPITIPKFPVPVIIDEPPASLSEPCKTVDIPETPAVHIPLAPELPPFEMPVLPQIIAQPEPQIHEEVRPEIDYNVFEYEPHMVVPQAPQLPAFTMPEFPVMPIVVAPCPEDEIVAKVPTPEVIQPLPPVPAAPELAPVHMPDFPVRVEIPQQPMLPPVDIFSPPLFIEQPGEEPCLNEMVMPEIDNHLVEYKPISVPQPPELPVFVMPELPKIEVEKEVPMVPAPCPEDQPAPVVTVPEYIKPLAPVPAAPKLPVFIMPEFPIRVVEQNMPTLPAPCPEDKLISELPEPAYIQPLAPIPAAPELPPAQLPEFPIRVEIPASPILPPVNIFPSPEFIEQPIQEPCLEEVVVPDVNKNFVEYKPTTIPQPPELPVYVMPEFPVRVVEQEIHTVPAPCPEEEPAPVNIQPLAPLPAAPELPPAQLPQFPIRVDIPAGPILPPIDTFTPPMFTGSPVEEPCLNEVVIPEIDNHLVEYKPISIPQPPVLPAFMMPELPKIVVEQGPHKVAAPCPEDEPARLLTVPEYIQPLAPLPVAPELPPPTLPEFPIHVEVPSGPVLPPFPPVSLSKIEEPCLTDELVAPQPEPIIIPQFHELPKLPKFEPVALPMPAFAADPCEPLDQPILKVPTGPSPYFQKYFPSNMKSLHKIMVPSRPIEGFFPSPSVYNFVMPNIPSDRFRSIESSKVLPSPVLPSFV